ncbi:MAG TPA: methionyl-tRNA formyltransferase [Candidatus Saccharimonadales bacterium]|nr:methionyl-tRNA formyltransferase [Candidatus Saccharimonadales bacterium]
MSSQEKKKIIFMGTPEFSLPGLSALITSADFEIVGVFTQPDKPVGRKQILTPPAVKVLALKNEIKVFQPEKIKTEIENIRALAPDLIVVIAYGKIISQEILDTPTYGCINVHASLLPKYRGAACLNAPILNGDKQTGITIMKMEAGLDTGPILKQGIMTLKGQETLADVHDYLSNLGAQLLPETLKDWMAGKIVPQIQDDSQASYIKTLAKGDGKIDWTKSAIEIERKIRAYNPWPGTFCYDKNGKITKILAGDILLEDQKNTDKETIIGQVSLKNEQLTVTCGQGSIIILKLQTEGGKALDTKVFLSGHQDFLGQILK